MAKSSGLKKKKHYLLHHKEILLNLLLLLLLNLFMVLPSLACDFSHKTVFCSQETAEHIPACRSRNVPLSNR